MINLYTECVEYLFFGLKNHKFLQSYHYKTTYCNTLKVLLRLTVIRINKSFAFQNICLFEIQNFYRRGEE